MQQESSPSPSTIHSAEKKWLSPDGAKGSGHEAPVASATAGPDWLPASETLVEVLGLSENVLAQRKQLLNLGPQDAIYMLSVAKAVQPHADANVQLFLDHLAQSPATGSFFADATTLNRVRGMTRDHLTSMLGGVYDLVYTQKRLELAVAYHDAGVEVHVFMAAYHALLAAMSAQILQTTTTTTTTSGGMTQSLQKVAFYDLGLFAEALVTLRQTVMRRATDDASAYARSLIEACLDPLVMMGPDGKITAVNEAATQITGLGREQLVGTDFSNRFTWAEKARYAYQQVVATGVVKDYPLTIRHASGREVDILYNARAYKDLHGNVTGVFATTRDVTVAKEATSYARNLIEVSLDPLVTISPDGKITEVNEATIQMTGVVRDKLVGTDFSTYFAEADKARAGYDQVLVSGLVTDYPLTLRHSSGREVDVLYNARTVMDLRGNVTGVFAAARDITGKKRAEAELAVQRSRELERIAELEDFQRLTVGRELKMIKLKKEIEALRGQVRAPT